ncbi:MAG: cis-3-alkyl-4-acyloxetan-2-one decarboxylase / olefin beta-lactone synthetase [Actinomycetota bacterium]|nr:cis-3-alkyl-4-acyloxetan-2-one decarboxylase / olefin beta-lactone synthetase [Actinomycetota bacterium]
MSLPPAGLSGLEARWSREVTAPDSTGVERTWHVLDSHAGVPADDPEPVGTLLCIHGNPSWSYLWRRIVAAPPAGWRVIAIDQLDMGFSERTGTVRPLAQRIDDVDALTDALGLTGQGRDGRIITVAHDWGGPISLGWALRHVDQLDGVVLANTGVHQPAEAAAPTVIRAARLPGVLPSVTSRSKTFIRAALYMSRPVPPPEVRAGFYAPYPDTDRRHAIENFVRDIPLEPDAVSARPLDAIAEGLDELADVPVLLLWGPRDPVFSDLYLRDLIDRMPHADVHRYEGSSHFVPEDAPTFAADVATWVATRSRTALGRDTPPLDRDDVRVFPEAEALRSTSGTTEQDSFLGPHLWSGIARRAADPETAAVAAVTQVGPDGIEAAISFADLDRRVEAVAAGLAIIGVQSGDRIALLVPPGTDLTAVLYGVWRVGAVAVVVDAGLGVRGMRTALRSAGPKYLIGGVKGLAAARLMATGAQLISVGPITSSARRTLRVKWSLERIERLGAGSQLGPPPPRRADPAAIAFTSGATGPAKGVLYLHRQLLAQRDALAALYSITSTDRLVAAFGPFALFGAALGIPAAVPDMDLTAPRTLTAKALGDAADAIEATLVFASPAAWMNVVATADSLTPAGASALAGVRLLLSTGAPVPAELLHDVGALLPAAQAHAPYGMTEVLPVADIDLAEMDRAGVGNGTCVGRPVPGVLVQLAPLDPAGVPGLTLTTDAGVTGEVLVQAAHTKERYDRLWVTEQAASTPMGWHRTGDVGHFDDEGRLWIEGRLLHVIVTADGPITPVGIERRVESVAGVRRAAAVGVGPRGTAQVVVVVEVAGLKPGLAPAVLREAVRAQVSAMPAAAPPEIAAVLAVRHLPVDIRHNSKIDRVAVGRWAQRVLDGGRVGKP